MKGMILPREPLIRIDSYLERLLHRSRALCVLLADISGQLISEKGNKEGLDTVGLAALAASNMAATAEMAKQIGESASFPYPFHEGREQHIYISAIGRTSILVVVFDEMTQIGLVRIFAKMAARELLEVVPVLEPWLEEVSAVVDREFGDALAEGLDKAFTQ